MSDQLRRALDDLVQGVATEQDARTRAGGGLPVDAMTARARRGRVRHTALVSAVTACAVLGVAAGGAAVAAWERPEPAPAAPPTESTAPSPTPTPTTTPSPSATAPAVVLPTGDAALPFGACGALVDAAGDVPLDDRWTIATTLASPEAAVGGGLLVSTRVDVVLPDDWSPVGVGFGIWSAAGPELLVVRDGVVVGSGDLYGDVPAGLESYDIRASANSPAYQGWLPLVSCSDGNPLPAGDYTVVPTARVLPLGDDAAVADELAVDGAESVAARHADDWRRTVGEPLDVVVVEGEPGALPPARTRDDGVIVPEPSCGSAVVTSTAARLLEWSVLAPHVVAEGSTRDTSGSLAYLGPGRLRLAVQTVPSFWAVQDGVVVGASPAPTDAYHAVVDLDRSSPLHLRGTLDVRTCQGGGPGEEPLPPGQYTLVPSLLVSGGEVRTAEGVRELPSGFVTGEAFPFVVE
ncbi:hypothetical protein [Cellulomonas pakistanensis]|uniref:Uncharacterized protein n=1 Tax=Cellulomonas pakistanensis TaxID=992287 RepID=A0A919U2E2_9CELL|nr:hypothetical protein [Cellulomonas pakistanensis]GIG35978.1 hypothetical protein Cpa01nite_13590 [Cellulomonas pakistanensis]